ncbi:MAG: pseudouridine-5'-phosphate glycosidase [Candidatus Promineifilaceae bacterium]
MKQNILYHPGVSEAIAEHRALVALESTVITHGLPHPTNVETAAAMETAVRQSGATPATIAIIQGQIVIGLTDDQLEYLGQRPVDSVRKCSRRDLAIAIAKGEDGGTTVAGTMILAETAGIELFATGGIGGVHRGHPFDVSADLAELGRTPVTVVCSGAKSILDLPLTREVLETNGVPVIGFGTDEMPAFYSRHSGLDVDARLDTPVEIAELVIARKALGLRSAVLVTVPVPAADALDSVEAEEAINQATREADEAGIAGPATTPWLLQRVKELTEGASLRANISLLLNNARVAGAIAVALSEMLV